MRITVAGGGPSGLYLALLTKKVRPEADLTVVERNPPGATYGWGVVFSDRTLTSFREADYPTYERIVNDFIMWDAIDVRYRGEVIRCEGQGFSGIARVKLLSILQERCAELGVDLRFDTSFGSVEELGEADLIVGADGIRSTVRATYEEHFRPRISHGRSRYIWFGTTRTFDSFTFAFRDNADGFFQAHAYPFDGRMSTFIVECAGDTWRRAGLDQATEADSIAYCEELFGDDLGGHPLVSNNSTWGAFVTLKNRTWSFGKTVLVGDAAHTAHFSIGSGTKLAMEDSIALANALQTKPDVRSAVDEYELERKPRVERFQEAARQSQNYFENTASYKHMEPLQFAFHLLSRSGRVDYDDLRVKDRRFVGSVDRWFSTAAGAGPGVVAAPPALAPLELRDLRLRDRIVVAAPPSYAADGGIVSPGSFEAAARAGAGLTFTEVIAVSPEGRISPSCPGIYGDDHEEAWSEELERTRSVSASALGITLNHSGPRGSTRPRSLGSDIPLPDDQRWRTVAASPVAYSRRLDPPDQLGRRGMDRVVEAFAEAAARARSVGFDAVELHMGHGYLLGSFISPITNRRTDEFGGEIETRMRFPLEVLDAVRAEWPDRLPVGAVLSASDWARHGIALEDAIVAAKFLRRHGCDIVRVVAGQTIERSRPAYDPYFLTHYADRIRNDAGVATIATGGIATVDHVNTIVAGGRAELCLLRTD